jgi:hypothetical protein
VCWLGFSIFITLIWHSQAERSKETERDEAREMSIHAARAVIASLGQICLITICISEM